jgi:hypothetical protein
MDIPTPEQFVARCEDFCRRHDMAETRFGRNATGEPQLLESIRRGRSPSLKVMRRVVDFMAEHEAALPEGEEWPIERPASGCNLIEVTDPAPAEAR